MLSISLCLDYPGLTGWSSIQHNQHNMLLRSKPYGGRLGALLCGSFQQASWACTWVCSSPEPAVGPGYGPGLGSQTTHPKPPTWHTPVHSGECMPLLGFQAATTYNIPIDSEIRSTHCSTSHYFAGIAIRQSDTALSEALCEACLRVLASLSRLGRFQTLLLASAFPCSPLEPHPRETLTPSNVQPRLYNLF